MSLDHRRGAVSAGPAGERILCGWDDCEEYGLMLHQVRIQYAQEDSGEDYMVRHLFCSERHRDYFRNGHVSMGNLPAGSRTAR